MRGLCRPDFEEDADDLRRLATVDWLGLSLPSVVRPVLDLMRPDVDRAEPRLWDVWSGSRRLLDA